MLSARERTRSEHEEKLEHEVSRLREQSARELSEIRNSGREVFERENKALRESRKDAQQVRAHGRTTYGSVSTLNKGYIGMMHGVLCM